MAKIAKISTHTFTNNNLSSSHNSKFNKFVDYIWPIKSEELPKFLFITLLMFCILGIQNLIRALKDSIVNTMIGTETIAFLKFWGVMPAAFMLTLTYVKLVNTMKGENIFYLIMSTFLLFFGVFAFYIFPNHESLHLNVNTANYLIGNYPNFKWFILLLSNWSFSLFYIIAELWPNVVFALLFWQFVNMVTSIEESKRFYPLFGLLGQTGLLISGYFLTQLPYVNVYLTKLFNLNIPYTIFSVQIVLTIVLILGIIGLFAFWRLNHRILEFTKISILKFDVKKQPMGLMESIKMVLSSKYIMLIAVLLISYGIAINLVEGPWKASASKIYTTTTEFAAFVGSYLIFTGVFTILFAIIGSNIVRKLGWFMAAIITPVMVFLTGILFFLVANFEGVAAFITIIVFFVSDPSLIAITIGAMQNVLSKSSKYSLFDSTKEMSYIPLDPELKTKGKAAADVLGTKIGKSASALLQSLIFTLLPTASYHSISMYLMMVFTIVCIIWIWAVRELDKEYKKAILNNGQK